MTLFGFTFILTGSPPASLSALKTQAISTISGQQPPENLASITHADCLTLKPDAHRRAVTYVVVHMQKAES
jgi:hypothetical protein